MGLVLCSALKDLQTGVVPFEIKGVLISDSQSDVVHVHENHKRKSNPKEPVNLKRKCSDERYEVNEKQLIAQRERDKNRRLNESPENREKRLARQRESNKKKSANESAECRQNRLESKRKYQKEKRINESAECRQNRLASKRKHHKESVQMNVLNVEQRD